MPFYRYINGEIQEAPTFVYAANYSLLAEEHATYTYPVEGWYWRDEDAELTPHIVVKSGYAIAKLMLEVDTPFIYPDPYDIIVVDATDTVEVGDWYEEAEDIFYRPINGRA